MHSELRHRLTGPSARRPIGPPGVALLDVLVALTILSTSGLAITALLRQAISAHTALVVRETTMDNADRVLAALTLLTRNDLDQRLGQHRIGEFISDIQRPESGLYRIALAEVVAPDRTLLVTVVHRDIGSPE